MKLNKNEKKIVSALRNNGRESMTSIAKKNDLAISSVANNIHRLEKKKIIEHKTIIDFETIGFPHIIIANIGIKNGRDELFSWLQNIPNINTLKEINDGLDFHIEAIFENKKQKQDFIRELKNFSEEITTNIHEVIKTINYETFLSKEEHYEQINKNLFD